MFVKIKVLIFYMALMAVFPFLALFSFNIGFLIADPVGLFAIILLSELIFATAFLNKLVYEPNSVIVITDTQVIEEQSLAH